MMKQKKARLNCITILFAIYGLFGYVEGKVPGVKELFFVDGVTRLVEDKSEDALSTKLEEAAKAA